MQRLVVPLNRCRALVGTADVHRAVVESGARVSGATVHHVSEEYDSGAIIAQWPVPVLPGRNNVPLIPPPQLPERHACELTYLPTAKLKCFGVCVAVVPAPASPYGRTR